MKPSISAPSSKFILASLLVCLVCVSSPGTRAQEGEAEKAASPLRLTAVDVTPEEPTPETLCKLSVTLANDAEQPISGLRFAVTVNGHPVPVYEKHVFLDVVPPGGEVTVPLYNFWVTETGRPLPDKGPLTVDVQVTDARWTKVDIEPTEPQSEDGSEQTAPSEVPTNNAPSEVPRNTETWTLLESLETLPDAVTATRKLRR